MYSDYSWRRIMHKDRHIRVKTVQRKHKKEEIKRLETNQRRNHNRKKSK